jgi:hypothetical protein
MMNPSKKLTHYEVLDIAVSASPFEINGAYRDAFELYKDDNMAACAFFSDFERNEILSRLEEAYLTLINPESRSAYDRTLMEHGIIDEETQYRDSSKGTIPIYNIQRKQLNYQWLSKPLGVDKPLATDNPIIQQIMKQDKLTGWNLKEIRTFLGVPLERICLHTKITIGVLEAIEENRTERLPPEVYLKGFLRLYAQCLQIDSITVIRGYMKNLKGDG